ncbi:MAG: Na/Pi cotransporter family protein, partial [Firmicutes bacterium]|nr:Na/Pi cotransporter family protein [Bacillota bacterium]
MNGLQIALTLFGGLALFIYGMNLMSDGLQKAAGEKMKSILALLTKNPLIGVLAGALVTAVIQSSSATTVMVIGFVSAGLMNLPQAISIILGANIGTTITAQLVAFKIGDYAWAFVIIGFIMFFFLAKKEKIMDVGQVLFGFGVLFVGLNIMGDAMKPLSATPEFADLMLNVADTPVLGVIVGALLTAVIQSSSASIAVLQNLASTAGPDG